MNTVVFCRVGRSNCPVLDTSPAATHTTVQRACPGYQENQHRFLQEHGLLY